MITKLVPAELTKIQEFCNKVIVARTARNKRNQDTTDKRINNEIIGKIGEYAAWKATGIGKVDFAIYADGNVTANCEGDLTPHTHVKTASASYRGTRYDGWLIGKHEKWVDKPEICDIVVLCYADDAGTVDVIGWVFATDVAGYYKRPVSPKLNHKTALYYNDIKLLIRPLEELKDEIARSCWDN